MLTNKRVLIIEDDSHICEVIRATLEFQNMNVQVCQNGSLGLQYAKKTVYDLIVLDLMLPGMDGLEVCNQLRKDNYIYPIIMLTAKTDEVDKILGLEIGADDYITKPFSPRELVARCKAAIRRFNHSNQAQQHLDIKMSDLVIKSKQYKAITEQGEIEFTPREFELLEFLIRSPFQTFTRNQILDHVWGFDTFTETRTVDEHIKRIRQKLIAAGVKSIHIKTIWGVGYQLEVINDG